MTYKAKKMAVFASLFLYFAAAAWATLCTPQREFYPFFGWYLFAAVPGEQRDYIAEILAFDGEWYADPVPFPEASFLFEHANSIPTEYMAAIRYLGYARTHGYVDAERAARDDIETIFRGKSAYYRILYVEYDPIEYWRKKIYATSSVVDEFSAQAQ